MSRQYSPQEGSVAWKVIEFFTTNPDEVLTTRDLEVKFDKTASSFHTFLGPAVESGMLVRKANDEDELVYSMGKGWMLIAPNKSRHPSLRPEPAQPGIPEPLHKNKVAPRRTPIDLTTVPILDGLAMPPRKGVSNDWGDKFKRMAVGQSIVLPFFMRHQANKACTEAKNVGIGTFVIRKLGEEEVGIWRVA